MIGLTVFQGGEVGAAYLAAVFISNLPEALSSTAGLASGGWRRSRILLMWTGIAVVSGLSSLLGYGPFQDSSPNVVAFVLAFAAGAILTMLADTMMPKAYEHGGKLVGVVRPSDSSSPSRSTPSSKAVQLLPSCPSRSRLSRRCSMRCEGGGVICRFVDLTCEGPPRRGPM